MNLALLVAAALAAAPGQLSVGLVASTNPDAAATQGQALAAFVQTACGMVAVPKVFTDYEALGNAVGEGKLDVALLPPFAFVRAEGKGKIEPLFKVIRNGQPTYRALLFGNSRTPVKSLVDFAKARPMKVAWVDSSSATGYLLPKALLLGKGINPAQAFTDQNFLNSHDAVCNAVATEQADLGATFTDDPVTAKTTQITGCKSALGAGVAKLTIVAASDAIPNDALVVRPGFDAALKAKLAEAAKKADKKVLNDAFLAEGITASAATDYAPVRAAIDSFKR
jgi:phosphonate transport system substrate-binding protein